jgi:hypothetical protein
VNRSFHVREVEIHGVDLYLWESAAVHKFQVSAKTLGSSWDRGTTHGLPRTSQRKARVW